MPPTKDKKRSVENPLTWWGDTPLGWNPAVEIWTGSGEMEALCELFFDNLATLLNVTGTAVFYIGYSIIGGNAFGPTGDDGSTVEITHPETGIGYGLAMAMEWEKVYFQKHIPGAAIALLFGNVYYAWMCGRLGAKENRTDVTAQPYGMNTTGIFITLFAVNLTALFDGGYKYCFDVLDGADFDKSVEKSVDYAWKVGVSANFLTGIFEICGCFLGDVIRTYLPTAAVFVPLTGVGFMWLAFSPLIDIAAEPMMCWLPFLIVMTGFFGDVRYPIVGKVTFPIALLAILVSVIIGWAGGCKKENGGAARYGYEKCPGTDGDALEQAYEDYAFQPVLTGIGSGLGGFEYIDDFASTLFLVAASSFLGTMTCVESAELAGDKYPMAETMIVDGLGTIIGAICGCFYSTTVYIGHPAHKALGAKRGYSLFNGILYCILLLTGLFASLYNCIPGCANGAILVFVGLLLAKQAFVETEEKHYPAVLLGIMPFVCNWAKLDMGGNQGVMMMGPAGGIFFGVGVTTISCFAIDRKFISAAVTSAIFIFLSLFGFFASHNDEYEKVGVFDKDDDDLNNGWKWAIAWTLAGAFFAMHIPLQKMGLIKEPRVDGEEDAPAPEATA